MIYLYLLSMVIVSVAGFSLVVQSVNKSKVVQIIGSLAIIVWMILVGAILIG